MKIIIALGIAVVYLFTWSLAHAAAPRTPEERAAEDEAQMKYLTEYNDRKRI